MRLVIESIRFRNFLSYGNKYQEFIPKKGVSLISGVNRDNDKSNGVGKTSLIETIPFALFGKINRPGVNLENIPNWKNKNNCEVQLKFSIGKDNYEIIRGLNPTVLKVLKNGSEPELFSGKRDYQKWLEDEILNIDFRTFINLLYLNMNNNGSIFNMKKWEKRDFIGRMFNLKYYIDIIEECNISIQASNKKSIELNSLKTSNLNLIRYRNSEISKLESKLSNLTSSKDQFDKIKKELKNIQNEFKNLKIDGKYKFDEILFNREDLEGEINKLKNKIKEENELKYKEEINITAYNSLIEDTKIRLEKMKGSDKCPLCWSKININHIEDAMNEDNLERFKLIEEFNIKIEEYEDIIKNIKDQIKNIENEIEVLKDEEKKYKEFYEEKKNKKINIRTTVIEYKHIKYKMKTEDKVKKDMLKNITENSNEIKKLEEDNIRIDKELKSINILLDHLEFLKNICKDDEVKQYAISSIIPFINKKINEYLAELGQPFYVELNKWLNEEIKGPGIFNAVYGNLSAGEQKSLDLSSQQAFLDLARLHSPIFSDILLYDELLDTSLDSLTLEKLLTIIRNKQSEDDSKVFIVSHREEISEIEFDYNYIIEKQNGFSVLKGE